MVSAKHVEELHALSVSEQRCWWNPDDSGVTLWTTPSFFSKVQSVAGYAKPLHFARFDCGAPSEPRCPVHALETCVSATATLRKVDSLLSRLTEKPGPFQTMAGPLNCGWDY
ncbi:hypothetical protein ATANTOWER_029208 [Ataeniobius toweri]|uniref:Uncharacterized protein n=1 Tax=Ataeniobius toweri TaxID=208326 RepID=A0ABU7BAG4_9TELE|nr:hypothetical protein [Ataeniobius toweri]